MVIEAMKKYRLFERFEKIVKAFVNGYDLVDEKAEIVKHLSLADIRKVQKEKLGIKEVDPEEFEGDATVRAKMSYEICTLMAHGGEEKKLEAEGMDALVNDFIRRKAHPISNELTEITKQEDCVKRQSTLRDVFRGYFQASSYHR